MLGPRRGASTQHTTDHKGPHQTDSCTDCHPHQRSPCPGSPSRRAFNTSRDTAIRMIAESPGQSFPSRSSIRCRACSIHRQSCFMTSAYPDANHLRTTKSRTASKSSRFTVSRRTSAICPMRRTMSAQRSNARIRRPICRSFRPAALSHRSVAGREPQYFTPSSSINDVIVSKLASTWAKIRRYANASSLPAPGSHTDDTCSWMYALITARLGVSLHVAPSGSKVSNTLRCS